MISDVYFPRINGVSTSIDSFRSELRALGHRVTLICPEYPEAHTLARANDHADDEDILRIPARDVIFDPEDRMMRFNVITGLIPILRSRAVDLVHIHTPFVAHYAGVKIARALNVPVVESYHTFFEEYLYNYIAWLPKSWLKSAARYFSRSQCNAVDGLIVPSTPMRNILMTYGVNTPMHIIPTGLNFAQFDTPIQSDFRAQLGITAEQPLLLYVGRVALEKNIDFLLDMMPFVLEKIPNAILVIAGEGPAERHIDHQINALGIRAAVKCVGYMRRDGALQDAYRAADVFVFASRTETQGLVLVEALALGTPVVALGVMGTLDVLNADGGCIIAPEDPRAFADEVTRLIQDQARHQHLAECAVRYAMSWSAEQKAQQILIQYSALIRQNSPAQNDNGLMR
jgi:glycosyltransferase involved in cell wall biosynthesis